MNVINLNSIGTVHSEVDENMYTNWGEVVSNIELNAEYIDGLLGLEDYSHVIIIFYMDSFREKFNDQWKRKPRGISNLDEKGCFAQRTKYRPNPIGITIVELLSITGNTISVKGLDANNGTQVLDIKPYIPEFDIRENTQVPNWMNELMKDYF